MRPEVRPGDTLVVKVGSTSLVGPSGEPERARLETLVDGLEKLRAEGIRSVLVSSGAIAAGLQPLTLETRPADIPSLQAAAAVGQGRLFNLYSRLLEERGVTAAQILLTRYDFMHRQQYLNARNTLERLLALGAVPIVNENDTIAVDEIRFGDNDRLAALVSNLVRAKLLLLLTDAKGLHASDPKRDPDAPVLDEVQRITPELERAAGGGRGSPLSSGGMASKLAAAWVATFSGVGVVVAGAFEPDILARVRAGEKICTYFHPHPRRVSARRLWIAFGQPPRGTVLVDHGARRAVARENRSLLAVGVVGIQGRFEAGDTVDLASDDGVFARGLVRFSSDELESAKGRRTGDLAGREVIHRDHLIVLEDPTDA